MEVLFALVWLALCAVGLIGFFKPSLFGLKSRWVALSIGSFSLVVLGIITEFFPPEGQAASSGSTIITFMVWLIGVFAVAGLRIAVRAQILSRQENPIAKNDSLVERLALRWGKYGAAQRIKGKTEWTKAKADLKASLAELRIAPNAAKPQPRFAIKPAPRPLTEEKTAPTPNTDYSYVDYSRDGVNDRLEAAFFRFRQKEISIYDYQDIIEQENRSIRDRIDEARAMKRALPRSSDMRDFYDDEIEEARDGLEEVRWRLDWIKDREMNDADNNEDNFHSARYQPSPPSPAPEPDGSWATFEYTNDYGTKGQRKLINWVDCGFTIRGYDQTAQGFRTFHKERIENVQSSSPLAPMAGIATPQERYGPVIQGPIMTEATFVYKSRGKDPATVSIANWIEYEKHVAGWDKESGRGKVFVKKQITAWHGDSINTIITLP